MGFLVLGKSTDLATGTGFVSLGKCISLNTSGLATV